MGKEGKNKMSRGNRHHRLFVACLVIIIIILFTTCTAVASVVFNIDWPSISTDDDKLETLAFRHGETAILLDLTTGISFNVRIRSLFDHLDVEPLTSQDTRLVCRIYGTSNAYNITSSKHSARRPMKLITSTGYECVCSMYGVPHGDQSILDNNFPGSICLHFLYSRLHGTGRIDPGHQEAIQKAIEIVNLSGEDVLLLLDSDTPIPASPGNIPIDNDHFPDDEFRAYLSEFFDRNKDGFLERDEIDDIRVIRIGSSNVRTIKGIEYFVKLEELYINLAQITELDVSHNYYLETLDIRHLPITKLDITTNIRLKNLTCRWCQLGTLDLKNNFDLETLKLSKNGLSKLDVSNNVNLTQLICQDNQIRYIDVRQNTRLENLGLSHNFLLDIDVSCNTSLKYLTLEGNPDLSEIDVSNNTELEALLIADDKIKKLDIRQNKKLAHLDCNDNELIELSTSNNPYLRILYCARNKLSSLNLENLTFGEGDYDFDGNIREIPGPVFDLSNLPGDFDINRASNWQGGTISGTILTAKEDKVTYEYDCGGRYTTTFTLIPVDGIPIDQEHFPDTNFRNYVKEFCDDDRNLCFTTDEIDQINGIFVSGLDIQSLQGIEYFSNLFELDCSYNQLTSLDVSKNPKLEYINCEFNPLESLDVRQNVDLQKLRIRDTDISEIDLSNNGKLTSFYGNHTKLSSIDFSHNSQLKMALCRFSEIDSVDLSGCTALEVLQLGYNKLEALDISDCISLTNLEFDNNNLLSIDVSSAKELKELISNNNQIQKLDISSNQELTRLYCTNNNLVELDLSMNSKINTLFCGGNQLTNLTLDELDLTDNRYDFEGNKYFVQNTLFDLSTLPGNFDINRASNWQGGTVDGTILTATTDRVTYDYDCGNGHTVSFTLLIPNKKVVVADELTEVPAGLNYETVELLKNALAELLLQIDPGMIAENTKTYDVKMLITYDGGQTWKEVSEEDLSEDGIDVVIPYPTGTNNGYTFYAVHMFTKTSDRLGTVAGNVEYPSVITAPDGLHMKLKGLSPVAISWKSSKETHSDIEFHAKVLWQVGSEHPKAKIQFYKNGVVGEHFLIETQRSADEWEYDAYDLSIGAEYYAVVEVKTGYYVEYVSRNMKETDKLFDGGVAIIRYMPPTGEFQKPWLYALITVISLFGTMLLVKKKNGW